MSTEPKRIYSLEEYFELERTSEERWEYRNGEVLCLSGVNPNHAQLEVNLMTMLNVGVLGRACRVFTGQMRIKVPTAPPYRYADLTVSCDKEIFEPIRGVETLTNPTLVIEVLSPLTEAYDRGEKFTSYKSIPSLREYLVVAQHRPHITHYAKAARGTWEYEEVNGLATSISLPSLDCAMELSEVYFGVEFGMQYSWLASGDLSA